jgi:DHA2 family multidrug resistance protein
MSQALSSPALPGQEAPFVPLTGGQLWLAAVMLAMANFIAVLNMTIANVAVPNIAGALGAATSQGTWVITAYAVGGHHRAAHRLAVVALRPVRVFFSSMVLFGVFSVVCGLAPSLGILVVARIFQASAGGPLMPLSQTLLMRIFPREKAAAAIGLWSMTTLVAPVVGPSWAATCATSTAGHGCLC